MILTLHGQVTLHGNILSDVRIARDAGYAALEVHTDKLIRFLDAGGTAAELKAALETYDIKAAAIDIIGGIEVTGRAERRELFDRTERLCEVAEVIGAPTIQVNPFSALDGLPLPEIIRITALNLREIAAIGAARNVRFQIEGAAWTPIHTLVDCLRLIEETDRNNVGLVIDYWHFWASRGAEPADIARLDPSVIYGVHMCDGYRPGPGEPWVDERELRGVLPGEGELPVEEWTNAIMATGFDGYISGEFLNQRLWERDQLDVATEMRRSMERFL
jgi:sugar phosphate isomerase/epimerase